jgi:hypothetical protein
MAKRGSDKIVPQARQLLDNLPRRLQSPHEAVLDEVMYA